MEPFLEALFIKSESLETHSEKETEKYAAQAAGQLKPGHVIALKGELGAGKTAFVKGLASALGGSAEEVSSPTFTILREIHGLKNSAGINTIYHFDFYRLQSFRELENTGYREMLGAEGAVIVAEWTERVPEAAGDFTFLYTLDHMGGDKRKIEFYVGKNTLKGVKKT